MWWMMRVRIERLMSCAIMQLGTRASSCSGTTGMKGSEARSLPATSRPGEHWLTDRNTVAYYASGGTLLYTEAGRQFLTAPDPETAWHLLRQRRVRLIALANRDPRWWPGMPIHAALLVPGRAEVIRLPRWDVYILALPTDATEAIEQPDQRVRVDGPD